APMYPEQYWQWHTWWIFPMFMPIFWIVMIGLCLYFIFGRRRSSRTWIPGQGFGGETALDILKKRYAKGEINKDEFEQMKRDISG
ncbi:MAG TPA: SHOCT domain-containing protein, partial [Desulfobaccales bacterium]|nr:SHOCT domain-containing protein [Desulfobaccales bacterium]